MQEIEANPFANLENYQIPDKTLTWAKEGYGEGKLSFEELQNPDWVKYHHEDWLVAYHEGGHVYSGNDYGLGEDKVSIIPEQGARGITYLRPRGYLPARELLFARMVAAYGGFKAQQKLGMGCEGCSFDLGVVDVCANQLSFLINQSSDSLKASAESAAASSVSRPGLKDYAWRLSRAKVFV